MAPVSRLQRLVGAAIISLPDPRAGGSEVAADLRVESTGVGARGLGLDGPGAGGGLELWRTP